ncbi:hypothetical protein NCS52_00598800 [Fusarium sp. LHS14.1]|nr:hypothetical protein NCS52_00598800 [Fusarium sp. LHS14.1]
MFAESDDPVVADFPDKRPASPSFEGDTRYDKKSRLQAAEPDFHQDFPNFFESHHYLPSRTPTSDNVLCDDARMVMDEGDDTELIPNRAESPVSDTLPDTCFGVITVIANSLLFRDCQKGQAITAAVDMRPRGSFIMLYTVDTGKYAGFVTVPALLKLLTEYSVKINASIVSPKLHSLKKNREEQDSRVEVSDSETEPTLRIIVYGAMNDRTKVGNLLSGASLFFQHPSPRDDQQLDLAAEYFNPHFLVRPGCQMPRLEDLVIASDNATPATCLDEAAKGQLMGIFDMAGDLGTKPTTTPSSRLRSQLEQHQQTALTMLSEKECFSLDMGQCTSLWEESEACSDETSNQSPNCIIRHIHPGQLSIATYHGTDRGRLAQQLGDHDIILTTYETLRSDWAAKGPLFAEEWFRVVLDEAHRIGNRSTRVFRAACDLKSLRRWCLTGTPIQNTLDDYGALLSFLRIPPFIEKPKFDHWISNPIRNKRPHGLLKLRILVQATCLRRTKQSINHSHKLPERTEKIERVDLHPNDRELYNYFHALANRIASESLGDEKTMSSKGSSKTNILPITIINFLRLICNHGVDLLSASAVEPLRLYQNDLPDPAMTQYLGESVVFSHWAKMLDLVQIALRQSGYSYERIDGQKSLRQRHGAISKFNNNPACTVLLATIGSAGEGIDLTSANYVHLMEPHWNPMAEEQAMARVHRIGQLRPVIATKYITPRSSEEVGYLSTLNNRDFHPANDRINQYVLEMQKEKLALSRKALDFAANSQQEVDKERWKTLRRYLDLEDGI